MKKALFIFRRDLRIFDNTALIKACQMADQVIPCFIFTPEQTQKNPYRSDRCVQFMIESLQDLSDELQKRKGKLYLFYGHPDRIVKECIEKLAIDGVFANRDYTPYSQKRDELLQKVCQKHRIDFQLFDDALLHPPEDVLKKNGLPYSVFTPYFRNACKLKVSVPQKFKFCNFEDRPIRFSVNSSIFKKISPRKWENGLKGGRREGLKILAKIEKFSAYPKYRDFPACPTTHLSPYLKFNVLSIREVYHAILKYLGEHHELIRSLYWRDFFTSIGFFFPHVFQGAFHPKWDRIAWKYDPKKFRKWCEGRTGIPIVDAGMRELNETGFMHNRVRMIAASFLVKDLHIDWRWGEKYFAQKLIDYDPCVNNGNWQWVASTGADAQPYFRIFNPWTQQKKFDPKCEYIRKWVPELKSVPLQQIHEGSSLYTERDSKIGNAARRRPEFEQALPAPKQPNLNKLGDAGELKGSSSRRRRKPIFKACSVYLAPIVDHAKESREALRMYRGKQK